MELHHTAAGLEVKKTESTEMKHKPSLSLLAPYSDSFDFCPSVTVPQKHSARAMPVLDILASDFFPSCLQ